jgi:thiol-disulfide isomerase/thioredoxin
MELEAKHIHAPELYGDFWFNSEPVSLRALHGQVVLLDFWDYSCVNCVRTLDYIRAWAAKYAPYGLVTVGVHTPEFRFARNPELLGRAIAEAGIAYPVVSDNEAIIWTAYAVRSWPTRCLVDKDGFIRFLQQGEGGYNEFERALQQLLNESGYRGEFPELTEPKRDEDRPGAVCHRPTGEIYLGYLRGTIGNPEGYSPESTAEYADPGYYLSERFYAGGKWLNGREALRFNGGETESGTLTLSYEAREVNAVMGSRSGRPCEVMITQDGAALTDDISGGDVLPHSGGRVRVDMPRMYRLVRNREFGPHQLRFTTTAQDLEVYTISFTTSVIPELVSKN